MNLEQVDPVMGGAIAEASLKALNDKKIFGVVTTHYANLKAFAANNIGVFNGSMLYDEAELKPKYKLETANPAVLMLLSWLKNRNCRNN